MPLPAAGWQERFDNEHGNDGIEISLGWLLFSDGAKRETSQYGVSILPPNDPYKLALLKLQYQEKLLKDATVKFQNLKSRLREAAKTAIRHGQPEPPPNNLDELRILQKEVIKHQRKVARARKQTTSAKPADISAREAIADENRQFANEFLDRLLEIKI